MFNVDTLTLSIEFIRYKKKTYKGKNIIDVKYKSHNTKKEIRRTKRELDYKYILNCDSKIKSKLILEDKDRKIRERVFRRRYLSGDAKQVIDRLLDSPNKKLSYYWRNKYKEYTFNYNEEYRVLLITLSHSKVEKYTAEQINKNVIKVIKELFGFNDSELNELKLNRIDVKCDYYYINEERFQVIKNIIDKAPEVLYSYQKEENKEIAERGGYYITYSSKNNTRSYVDLGP